MNKWNDEIAEKYFSGISNAFVITGNIGDYVKERILFKDFLFNFLKTSLKMSTVIEFNLAQGAVFKVSSQEEPENYDWEDICSLLKESKDGRTAVVITYPEFLVPDGNISEQEKVRIIALHSAMNSAEFMTSDNLLIFITESARSINPMFLNSNSKTSLIDIGLPNEKQRFDFITFALNKLKSDDKALVASMQMEVTYENFAMMTSGLMLINIDDIIMNAIESKCLNRNMVIERKKELIRKEFGEIIEILDTDGYGLKDFAGQEHLKSYFRDVMIDAINDGDIDIVPKGVLLMGPPGTGKTYFSRCLAGDAGINFVEFKMSKILNKWVGESEKRMEKALSVFRALAPVGIFMDEIDQTLNRQADGSGHEVSKNLFGMLLAEMSRPENRGKLIWLGATNYPNNIDEALKRAGRFDKKVPFFAPDFEDRKNVFNIHLKKSHLVDFTNYPLDFDYLSTATDGFTQAEIEGIVLKAIELVKRDKKSKERIIKDSHLKLALQYMASAQNKKIQEMEDIALKEVNDLEFVPEKYLDKWKMLNDK